MAIIHLPNNPDLIGIRRVTDNVRYSEKDGGLTMTLFVPREPKVPHVMPSYPLVVYVQGSGWGKQDRGAFQPELGELAMKGFVVASIYYRNALDGYPFPCYLQDIKTGIRFLRKNAEKFHIQPDRVAVMGTSSGANTALLVGLTGDDPAFETEEHAGYSDAVNAVVSYYAPTDMETFGDAETTRAILEGTPTGTTLRDCLIAVVGNKRENLKLMSPTHYLDTCKNIPPMLLFHGTVDEIVPFSQATEFYEKLQPLQPDVNLYCVDGALHGDTFWSRQVLDITYDFLKEKL